MRSSTRRKKERVCLSLPRFLLHYYVRGGGGGGEEWIKWGATEAATDYYTITKNVCTQRKSISSCVKGRRFKKQRRTIRERPSNLFQLFVLLYYE